MSHLPGGAKLRGSSGEDFWAYVVGNCHF